MTNSLKRALMVWLLVVAAAASIVAGARYAADLSAFLPKSPTPAQQVLVDQLRDGAVSRLILVGISGASAADLAKLSTEFFANLRQNNVSADSALLAIHNGAPQPLEADQQYLFKHRYLLNPAINAGCFSVPSLSKHLQEALATLASPAGLLSKDLISADPTGEVVEFVDQLAGQSSIGTYDGVWMSADHYTAIGLLQTRAAGFDIDAQERTVASVRAAFARAQSITGLAGTRLDLAGPGVYSVSTRATIKNDAIKFSSIATILVTGLLFITFRSPRVLVLGLLPLATGALCGIAAVALAFGEVHGITLGFGATLIGEAVDYAIYLFMQSDKTRGAQHTLTRIWPTLRLGVLTSIVGFSAMLLSGFPGLSQLGLFSMVGLIAAVSVTRYVLPHLLPVGFEVAEPAVLSRTVMTLFRSAFRLRWLIAAMTIIGIAVLWRTEPLWSEELSSLSPLPIEDQRIDERLRRELGAADVRHLVVARGENLDEALALAEQLAPKLDVAIAARALKSYDSPAKYLPSSQAQQSRRDSIPDRDQIEENLGHAIAGTPFRRDTFTKFVDDLEATKKMAPIDRATLNGTQFALKFDSLMLKRGETWWAMLPLSGVSDRERIARALDVSQNHRFVLLDTKAESDSLYAQYRREAMWLAAAGAGAIAVLLFASMRSVRRLLSICVPLAAAVIVSLSVLVLLGHILTIFHLVGVLLVVAVGSNYALFFDRGAVTHSDQERTSLSLALANLTTVMGFGLLGFSNVPVLQAIGATVGIGAFLSLVFAAALAPRAKLAQT